MDEKLTELVRKCDELYDISHKKLSDRQCMERKIVGTNRGRVEKIR